MSSLRLSACALLVVLILGDVLAARPSNEIWPSRLLFQEFSGDLSLELMQKKVMKISNKALSMGHKTNTTTTEPRTTTGTTTTTTGSFTTTTTTDYGPDYLIMSSRTTGSIYSWDFASSEPHLLIEYAGANPSGIAVDLNLGYIYYTDPVARQIVRYELEIRDGQVGVYDHQPVPVAQNVDAEWIAVNEYSNLFWTDPVDHTIKKMYWATLEQIAKGVIQPDQLSVVSYMDIYLKLGKVPSLCYDAPQSSFPSNCTSSVTCNLCQDLNLQPYIYKLYSDMGHPSGMQVMPGNRMLWGNMVDGYYRGTVVEAENEPTLPPGAKKFPIRALTYLWDSVFNFLQMPNTALGGDILYVTTNGTLGIPPIPGDVVGALVAVTPNTTDGASQSIVLDFNLVKPRSLVWNGHEKIYVADDWGIRVVNSGMMVEGTLDTKLMALPGAAGLARVSTGDPCYPLMISRGLENNPSNLG